MSGVTLDENAIVGRIQVRQNPRAPKIDPTEPLFRLRAADGRWLNIDGSGLTDGPHRYVATKRRLLAMRKVNALAAGCKVVEA